jgi:hypothetical protein
VGRSHECPRIAHITRILIRLETHTTFIADYCGVTLRGSTLPMTHGSRVGWRMRSFCTAEGMRPAFARLYDASVAIIDCADSEHLDFNFLLQLIQPRNHMRMRNDGVRLVYIRRTLAECWLCPDWTARSRSSKVSALLYTGETIELSTAAAPAAIATVEAVSALAGCLAEPSDPPTNIAPASRTALMR